MAEGAQKGPRRFDGKPVAIVLATVLVVGTALSTYFAWHAEVARQTAHPAAPAAP